MIVHTKPPGEAKESKSKREYLNAKEYGDTQTVILRVARTLEGLPLWQFVDTADKAIEETAFVDPRLFHAGHKRAEKMKELAEACRVVVEKLRELK